MVPSAPPDPGPGGRPKGDSPCPPRYDRGPGPWSSTGDARTGLARTRHDEPPPFPGPVDRPDGGPGPGQGPVPPEEGRLPRDRGEDAFPRAAFPRPDDAGLQLGGPLGRA